MKDVISPCRAVSDADWSHSVSHYNTPKTENAAETAKAYNRSERQLGLEEITELRAGAVLPFPCFKLVHPFQYFLIVWSVLVDPDDFKSPVTGQGVHFLEFRRDSSDEGIVCDLRGRG